MFNTGTRALEILNGITLVLWSLLVETENGVVFFKHYSKLAQIPDHILFTWFLSLGVSLLLLTLCDTARAKFFSGIIMIVSALSWSIVAIEYLHILPFKAVVIAYASLSVISFWGGNALIDYAKEEQRKNNGICG